jgi:DNA polymerase III subunit gamma/tau
MMAAEMAVIRLTHVADMPTPDEALRKLGDAPKGAMPSAPRTPAPPSPPGPRASAVTGGALPAPAPHALDRFARFDDVVALIRANRDMGLLIAVENNLRLARYQPGRIEITPTDDAPPDLAQRLGARLQVWTGARWVVSVTADGADQPTIGEVRAAAERQQQAQVEQDPLVLSILTAFPRAKITAIRAPAPPAEVTVDDTPDDWDPFEEG